MDTTDEIDQLANQIYNYYRDLGSSRQNLTRNDIFRSFNLNNENSKAVFERAEQIGVKFKTFNKKDLVKKVETVKKTVEKNPLYWGNINIKKNGKYPFPVYEKKTIRDPLYDDEDKDIPKF